MFANIEDLRQAARRRLPRLFFEFVDGGSFAEAAMRANIADFDRIRLTQRVLADVSGRSLKTNFLGGEHRAPFMLAPVGFAGMLAHRGEAQAARAAAAAGIPVCLSSSAICPIEEVRAATDAALYFQMYLWKDPAMNLAMIERATKADAKALFLTVDTTVSAAREKDHRNGFLVARRPTSSSLLDMFRHVRWMADMARGPWPVFGNYPPILGKNIITQASAMVGHMKMTMGWDDVDWVRSRWRGPLVVKGVMSAADALLAIEHGADAVVVSNHGGRQFDSGPSSIAVLPEIVAAVGSRTEILFDGGIRRGSHIAKALALGARACLIGRAYAYGLGAAGQAGVARAIELLQNELSSTLGALGLTAIDPLRDDGVAYIRRE